jgi:hypothetical protein
MRIEIASPDESGSTRVTIRARSVSHRPARRIRNLPAGVLSGPDIRWGGSGDKTTDRRIYPTTTEPRAWGRPGQRRSASRQPHAECPLWTAFANASALP